MVSINRQLRERARTTAEEFDTRLVHNRVYEQVQGQHTRDPDLRRVLELSEECYGLSDARGGLDDIVGAAAFDAAESLNGQLEALVDEAIAEACAVIVRDAPGWDDSPWTGDEIDAAVDEAWDWLTDHEAAARRAGVKEVLDDE